MTTDITELAQRMRIAATMASQGAWSYARSGFNSIVRTSANLPSGGASRVVLCKLFRSEWRGELKTAQDAQFIALANPANVLALVEELEKAQQRIEELESDLSEWTDCKHDGATYYDMSGQERCGRCGADV
ncbi:ead/Ea22-like family protein [Klebsiella pneumoniae]|uniref:ead/Ea22-like family protein n=1 Tax=Klebsiella pneumoniae TaxID=573 RepID=UPI003D36FCF1